MSLKLEGVTMMLDQKDKKKKVGGEKEKMNSMNSLGLGAPYFWEAKYKAEMEDIIGDVECFDWYLTFDKAWDMIESFIDPKIGTPILKYFWIN